MIIYIFSCKNRKKVKNRF